MPSTATDGTDRAPRLPPRWFVRGAWVVHRAYYRLTRGRRGLWRPRPDRWGTLRLHTVGRRTGNEHTVIVGYVEDGPNLVTLAMNGWAAPEPAWWLNLQADPEVTVDLQGGTTRTVRARAAEGAERERLWETWRRYDDKLEEYAARRPTPTAVVVLEPRPSGRSGRETAD
ncbi:nitroreductase/quinone reductase family protein [Oerskovia flava]|uniref:nitroreductase/quinone reductase family protein n=1 Tax=Oerskovia flava TaxID=2986422 RepID=UPI00223ECA12|nr:nitroreductase/quinone reductase family protein [Oerskovia sp. JB1-3-2]